MEKAKVPKDVPEYIAAAPKETRVQLRDLRKLIKAAVPKAVESISYGMPYYKYNGRPLTGFAAYKNHVSVYALPVHEHRAETKAYVAAKGTLHFPIGGPMPTALLTKLVKGRAKLNEAKKG